MRYSNFSVNNIDLSVIWFPLWTLATKGWSTKDPDISKYLLQQAFEQGINFYDTADSYGKGYAEELLKEALSPVRHEIVISTKFGHDFYSPQLDV
ncbi:MAG: aldo/keto reductase, partial [Chloroflexota bacterium]|nr:aldo/keto reductase [Chloroflexota bacterium]